VQLTELKALLGCVGETRFVMGCISQLQDGRYFLEDLSDALPIDLSEAQTTSGFFTGKTPATGCTLSLLTSAQPAHWKAGIAHRSCTTGALHTWLRVVIFVQLKSACQHHSVLCGWANLCVHNMSPEPVLPHMCLGVNLASLHPSANASAEASL